MHNHPKLDLEIKSERDYQLEKTKWPTSDHPRSDQYASGSTLFCTDKVACFSLPAVNLPSVSGGCEHAEDCRSRSEFLNCSL